MRSFTEIRVSPSFPELALEKALSNVLKEGEKRSNPALSPSGMGCKRAAAFKLSGALVEASEETYESGLPAAMGTFIHERIQKFLSVTPIWVDVKEYILSHPELGLEVAKVQKHKGEISLTFSGIRDGKRVSPPFSFQCDGILFIDGEYYIMEIKSESETNWAIRTAPNPKHADQATGYAFLYGIDKILWVYASRESFGAHRKIFLQKVESTRIKSFLSDCNDISKAIEKDDIASLPKAKDCRWCAYRNLCESLD